MAPGHTFKWVKPEVYPLIVPVVLALGAMTYSMGRHLWTNPEVFPNKKLRSEGIPEEPVNKERAQGYASSVFRSLQEGKGLNGIFGSGH